MITWIVASVLLLVGVVSAVAVALKAKSKPQIIQGHFKRMQEQAGKDRE